MRDEKGVMGQEEGVGDACGRWIGGGRSDSGEEMEGVEGEDGGEEERRREGAR